MSLANVLHLGGPAPDLGMSELDEISAMVYLGDIYSVLLLAATGDHRAAADLAPVPQGPLDTVWPFIR